jgi:hypothetical protein
VPLLQCNALPHISNGLWRLSRPESVIAGDHYSTLPTPIKTRTASCLSPTLLRASCRAVAPPEQLLLSPRSATPPVTFEDPLPHNSIYPSYPFSCPLPPPTTDLLDQRPSSHWPATPPYARCTWLVQPILKSRPGQWNNSGHIEYRHPLAQSSGPYIA